MRKFLYYKQMIKNEIRQLIVKIVQFFVSQTIVGKFIVKMNYTPYIVRDINEDVTELSRPRALISYINAFFNSDDAVYRHTNMQEASLIVKYFIDRNYIVDVVKCTDDDLEFLKNSKYDVIFGFGKPYRMACKYNNAAKKITYLTECSPDMSMEKETERIEYYYKRHAIKTHIVRSGTCYSNDDLVQANISLFMGNSFTDLGYYKNFPDLTIIHISPTGFYNNKFKFLNKTDMNQCNFVWFGSNGAIHKGLDILLDVFKDKPELQLYVCGLSNNDKWIFCGYEKYKNIHSCGFLNVQSEEYLKLLEKVTFVILPSCAEGMATSVLTCMRHACIPVITRNTGITLDDFGYYLEDYHVESISEDIDKIVEMYDLDRINRERKVIYESANKAFSIEKYKENLYRIMDEVLH